MTSRLDFSEVRQYETRLRKVGRDARPFLPQVEAAQTDVYQEMVVLVPFLSGELLRSIQRGGKGASAGEAFAEVEARADHAAPVEYGHRLVAWGHDTGRMVPPQPYARPAVSRAAPGFQRAVARRAIRLLEVGVRL